LEECELSEYGGMDEKLSLSELDERIAVIRENISELIEQAAAYSGAADEELAADRIEKLEARLEDLLKRRDEILGTSN
jgi:hypothetical protein